MPSFTAINIFDIRYLFKCVPTCKNFIFLTCSCIHWSLNWDNKSLYKLSVRRTCYSLGRRDAYWDSKLLLRETFLVWLHVVFSLNTSCWDCCGHLVAGKVMWQCLCACLWHMSLAFTYASWAVKEQNRMNYTAS